MQRQDEVRKRFSGEHIYIHIDIYKDIPVYLLTTAGRPGKVSVCVARCSTVRTAQSVSQSVRQSVAQPASQPVSQSVNGTVCSHESGLQGLVWRPAGATIIDGLPRWRRREGWIRHLVIFNSKNPGMYVVLEALL